MFRKLARFSVLVPFLFVLEGCVWGYSNPSPSTPLAAPKSGTGPTSFHATRGAYWFGGRDGAIEAIHTRYPAAERRDDYDPPKKGVFLRVQPREIELSNLAKAYGYAALWGTFGAIPFYNGSSGYEISYDIFRDGAKVKHYSYEVNRRVFIWLPALVLLPVNAGTDSEKSAVRDTTLKFFEDAERDHAFEAMPSEEAR